MSVPVDKNGSEPAHSVKNAIDDQSNFSLVRFASHAVAEFRDPPHLVIIRRIASARVRMNQNDVLALIVTLRNASS